MHNSIDLKSIKKVWSPLAGSQTLVMSCPANVILYHGTRGPGKRISNNTPVLTDSGWKDAGDITYSDKLVALDGSFVAVKGIYPCKGRDLFNVEFQDGAIVEADAEHRWLTLNSKTGYREGWKVRTTEKLMNMSVPCSVPYISSPIHGEKWEGLDPYAIGYIIANGTTGSKNTTIYSIDEEILEYFRTAHGWNRHKYEGQTAHRAVCPQATDNLWRDFLGHRIGDEKFVPKELLVADPETRLALLQGLMDGDGNFEKGATNRYSTVSEQLANDVAYLVKSLGGWASVCKRDRIGEHYTYGNRGYIFHVNLSHHNKFNPFRLKRKAERVKEQKAFLTRGIKSITFSRVGDGVCFEVDHKDHCFVCGDFVVTHNTDAQLMRFRRNVGLGYGRFWRGVIFDREYKNLDDLVSKSMRWFPAFKDGARFLSGKSDYRWVWPTGEELLFRVLKRDADYWGYHGQEFAFIGWNELTKFGTGSLFEAMMSCNRTSFRPEDYPITDSKTGLQRMLPKIPLEVMATCNPHGIGHNWVKKKFINAANPGQIFRTSVRIFNPQTQKEEDVVKTQVHIFGSYRENKFLSPEYVAELNLITDPNKKKAWLGGSWDIVAGGMFDDVWDTNVHKVKPFNIPVSWKIDRSFDWGSSKPFSVGWWAESDGSDYIDGNGKVVSSVRGDLFRIGEWYGTSGKTNEGLRMLATDIATGIIERELAMRISNRVIPGPADNSIFDTENGNSIAKDMEKRTKANGQIYAGVKWARCDKSAGSRKAGWEKLRLYLQRSKKINGSREQPGMFIFDNCKHFLDLFPILPRDEVDTDDVDTDSEDHIGDEARYRILATNMGVSSGTTKGT